MHGSTLHAWIWFPQYPKLTTATVIVNQIDRKTAGGRGKQAGKPLSPGISPGNGRVACVAAGRLLSWTRRADFSSHSGRCPRNRRRGRRRVPGSASQEACHVDLFREASLAVALGSGSLCGAGGRGIDGRRQPRRPIRPMPPPRLRQVASLDTGPGECRLLQRHAPQPRDASRRSSTAGRGRN